MSKQQPSYLNFLKKSQPVQTYDDKGQPSNNKGTSTPSNQGSGPSYLSFMDKSAPVEKPIDIKETGGLPQIKRTTTDGGMSKYKAPETTDLLRKAIDESRPVLTRAKIDSTASKWKDTFVSKSKEFVRDPLKALGNVWNYIEKDLEENPLDIDSYKRGPKGKIEDALNTAPAKAAVGFVAKQSSDLPIKAIAGLKATSPETTYKEAYTTLKSFGGDTEDPAWQKFLYQLQNTGGQTAIGVAMSFIPVFGKPLSSAYWTAISSDSQIQEYGEVKDLTNIAIDVAGDQMLGSALESIFKSGTKGFLKTMAQAGFTEGGTEVFQSMLKMTNDYARADSREQKQAIIEKAKDYITSGDILMEFAVGATVGGGIAAGGYGINKVLTATDTTVNVEDEKPAKEILAEIPKEDKKALLKDVKQVLEQKGVNTAKQELQDKLELSEAQAEDVIGFAMPTVENFMQKAEAYDTDTTKAEIKADAIELINEDGPEVAQEFLGQIDEELAALDTNASDLYKEIESDMAQIEQVAQKVMGDIEKKNIQKVELEKEMENKPVDINAMVSKAVEETQALDEQDIPADMMDEANKEWDTNPEYGETVGRLAEKLDTLEKQLKTEKREQARVDLENSIKFYKDNIDSINNEFVSKWQERARLEQRVKTQKGIVESVEKKAAEGDTFAKNLVESNKRELTQREKDLDNFFKNNIINDNENKQPTKQSISNDSRRGVRASRVPSDNKQVRKESGTNDKTDTGLGESSLRGEQRASSTSTGERPTALRGKGIAEKISSLESNLQETYRNAPPSSVEGFTVADEALSNLLTALELAEAGYRVKIGYGKDTVWQGVPSTFPQWIPQNSRNKEDLEYLLQAVSDITNLTYPAKSSKKREFMDAMLDQLDSMAGLDTKDIRNNILKLYETESDSLKKYRATQKESARSAEREQAEAREQKEEELIKESAEIQESYNFTNEQIEEFAFKKTYEENGEILIKKGALITERDRKMLLSYVPAGGSKEATGKGLLDEYYTPEAVVEMTYDAVSALGVKLSGINILEPSLGIGGFTFESRFSKTTGHEINPLTSRIAKLLHPRVTVKNLPFEDNFIDSRGNKKKFEPSFDLVVGNPPYGKHRGIYKGLGEEPAIASYEEYFIKRSLDLTVEGGHVALVVPSGFLRNKVTKGKRAIAEMAELVIAYRLPNGVFDTTDVGTDLVIFKKAKAVLNPEVRAERMSDDDFFSGIDNKKYILGTEVTRKGQFGEEEAVTGTLDDAFAKFSTVKYSKKAESLATDEEVQADIEQEIEQDVYKPEVYESTYKPVGVSATQPNNPLAQTLVDIVTSRGGDINAGDLAMSIKNEPYMELDIERIAADKIAISHISIMNGDIMRDPEIVFKVRPDGALTALTFENSYAGVYKEIEDSNEFMELWSTNLREQGFLKEEPTAAEIDTMRQEATDDVVKKALDARKQRLTNEGYIAPTQKDLVTEAVKDTAKSIKQIAEETGIKEPNIRRILGVGAKEGTFERVEQGVYVLSKNGEDIAYVETGNAVESLPRLASEGFKADMVFLDIPYDTPAVKGGNRGVKYNLVSVAEFGIVLDAVKEIARTETSPVIHMYSQAESGLKAMEKYNNLILEKGFKPVGKGQYQKTFADGSPVTSPNGKVSKPEGILVFTKSGELNKDLQNLNFTLKRPKGYQTEKPAEMLKAMIEMTTEEGDMVLDPFAGSGVTGAEAIRAGRKAYLIEKDVEVAQKITRERVKKAAEEAPNVKRLNPQGTTDEIIDYYVSSFGFPSLNGLNLFIDTNSLNERSEDIISRYTELHPDKLVTNFGEQVDETQVEPEVKEKTPERVIDNRVTVTTTKKTTQLLDLATQTGSKDSTDWDKVTATGELEGDFDKTKAFKYEGKWYNKFNYTSGDIYEKMADLERNKSSMSESEYTRHKDALTAVLPPRVTIDRINVSPHTRFVSTTIMSNGQTLAKNFKEFLGTLPYNAFGNSSAYSIKQFMDGIPVRGNDKIQNESERRSRREEAQNIFNKYIAEEMSAADKKILEDEFNKNFNAIALPNYIEVPLTAKIHSEFKNKTFELRGTQKQGVGFLVNKGVGLLAHDVGLGKTSAGVVANAEMLARGWAKKPLIILPSTSVYEQWIKEIMEIIPDVKINKLANLGGDFKGDLQTLTIPDGSISVITYEGFKKLGFKDETYTELTKDMRDAIAMPADSKRRAELEVAKVETQIGKGKKGTGTQAFFEDLGFDLVTFDEVHNANHIIGSAKADEGKSSEFSRGFQLKPSELGIKTWLASQFILKNNNNRNVFLLSATPFTNHPLEYYSILSLVAREQMKRMGIFNVNDFMSMFMDISTQYEFKADGTYVEKNDVRGFKNYQQLMGLVTEFIDFKDGKEAGIIRPEKNMKEYVVAETETQKQYKNEAQALFDDKKGGGVLKAIGEMRQSAFSPYASMFSTTLPTAKQFVENSPKIKATVELIKQSYKDNPDANQLIYSPVGVEYFPLIKQYLVDTKVFLPNQVEIISGATSKDKRSLYQEKFNKGEIKLIIGSDSIQEGINLQQKTTDLYILSLPWNFTAMRQVIGRLWRYGNEYMNVRINNMFTENSLDIFLSQKLQNKEARYDSLLEFKGDYVDVSDIDFNELKLDLLTDPKARTAFEYELKKKDLQVKITQKRADIAFKTRKADKYVKQVARVKEAQADYDEDPTSYWGRRLPEEIKDLEAIKKQTLEKGINVEEVQAEIDAAEAEIDVLEKQLEGIKNEEVGAMQAAIALGVQETPARTTDYAKFIREREEENLSFYQKRPLFQRVAKRFMAKDMNRVADTFFRQYLSPREQEIWLTAMPAIGDFMKHASQADIDTLNELTARYTAFEDAQLGPKSVLYSKVSTKILEQLQGRTQVSKDFVVNLTKQSGIKEAEKNIILETLLEQEDNKVNVHELAESIQGKLLKITSKEVAEQYEYVHVAKEKRGDVKSYHEVVHEVPFTTPLASRKHFRGATDNYFAHERYENMSDGVTQRVLELQSDLMQKGTFSKEKQMFLAQNDLSYNEEMSASDMFATWLETRLKLNEEEVMEWLDENTESDLYDELSQEFMEEVGKNREAEMKVAEPYKNTWHELLIRKRIQTAAEENMQKLLYPTGETALAIEGLGVAQTFKIKVGDNFYQADATNIKVGMEIAHTADLLRDMDTSIWIITDILEDGKFKAVPSRLIFPNETGYLSEELGYKYTKADKSLAYKESSTETFDISGKVDTKNPIYQYYENSVYSYLNKVKTVNRITDEAGLTWFEVEISESDKQPYLAFSKQLEAFETFKDVTQERTLTQQEALMQVRNIVDRHNLKVNINFVDEILTGDGDTARGAYFDREFFFSKNEMTGTTPFHEVVHFFDANWNTIKAFDGLSKVELYEYLNNGPLSTESSTREAQLLDIQEKLAEMGEAYFMKEQTSGLPDIIKEFFARVQMILARITRSLNIHKTTPEDMFRVMMYARTEREKTLEFKNNTLANYVLRQRGSLRVADFGVLQPFADGMFSSKKDIIDQITGNDALSERLSPSTEIQPTESFLTKLKAQARAKGISNEQIATVEKFIDLIGPNMFDTVGLSIESQNGAQAHFDYVDSVVTFFINTINQGKTPFDRVAIHELWHTLSRFVPQSFVSSVKREYTREYNKYVKQHPWFAEFNTKQVLGKQEFATLLEKYPEYRSEIEFYAQPKELLGKIASYTMTYDDKNYRFKDIDEWFAEKMTDNTYDTFASMDVKAQGIIAHFKNIIRKMTEAITEFAGLDETKKLYNLFLDNKIANSMTRTTPLQGDGSLKLEFNTYNNPMFKKAFSVWNSTNTKELEEAEVSAESENITAIKKDINWFYKNFAQSRDIYLKDPQAFFSMNLLENIGTQNRMEKAVLDTSFSKVLDAYIQLPKKQGYRTKLGTIDRKKAYEKVDKILVQGDIDGQNYSRNVLEKRGLNENEIEAYLAIRKGFDIAYDMIIEKMIEIGTPVEEIETYRKNKAGYIPHRWKHPFNVKIYDLSDGARERGVKYEELVERIKKGESVQNLLEEGLLKIAAKTDYKSEKIAREEAAKQINTGTIAMADKDASLAVDFFSEQYVSLEKMKNILNNAKVDKEVKIEMINAMRDMFKEKGFARTYMRRYGTQGYQTEYLAPVIANYFSGFTGYMTKVDRGIGYYKILSQIDARKQPNLYKYTKDLISYDMGASDGRNYAKTFAFTMMLANDIGYLMVNTTQNLTVGAGELSKYMEGTAQKVLAPEARLLKAMIDWNTGNVSSLEKAMTEQLIKLGRLGGEMVAEQMGFKNNPLYENVSLGVTKALYSSTAYVEKNLNRVPAFIAAYRLFIEQGMEHQLAVSQALAVSEDIHFRAGKHQRPVVLRGNIAQTLFVFMGFSRSFFFNLYQDIQKREFLSLSRKMFWVVVIGGISSIPFYGLYEVLKQVAGIDDDDEEIKKELSLWETLYKKGIPAALLQADLSQRVGLEFFNVNLILQNPNSLKAYLGAVGSIFMPNWADPDDSGRLQKAFMLFTQGRTLEAFGYALPDMFANPIKGIVGATQGVTSFAGTPLEDAHGDAFKYNTYEAIIKALGITPTRESIAWDAKSQEMRKTNAQSQKQVEIKRTIQAQLKRGEIDAARELQQQAYEQGIISEGTDYIKSYGMDKFLKDAVATWDKSAKTSSDKVAMEKELIENIYGGVASDTQINSIRKDVELYTTFGLKNEYANQLNSAKSNNDKIDVLVQAKIDMTSEEFSDFYSKARKEVKLESGKYSPVLISDPLDETWKKVKNNVTDKTTESKDEKTFIEEIATYAKALGTDPVTAFNRILTNQKIRKIENGTIIIERNTGTFGSNTGVSTEIRNQQNATESDRLDHTIPIQLGGSDSPSNLKLVPQDTHASYTPVENYLGRLLKDGAITKDKAQDLIIKFKNGEMTAAEIYQVK
jgi:hypothetical protein